MKVLVIQIKMIGDVLASTVICEALKKEHPNCEIHYLIQKNTYPVVENNPFIDKVLFFEEDKYKGLSGLFRLGTELKLEKYQTIIDVYGKFQSLIPTYLSGAKKRILFFGETYRADAITWMNGLREFGDFEIVTWELKTSNNGFNRIIRLFELAKAILTIKSIVKKFNPDMVIAERTTSYGYLAAISGLKPMAIAQQGITDLWPHNSPLYIFKKRLQNYAFKKADLIHAWGNSMAEHMKESNVDMDKVMILPKGINLDFFQFNDASDGTMINAVVTRSLEPEYKHDLILKAFSIVKQKNISFKLTINLFH